MAIPEMKAMLDALHNKQAISNVNKVIQIREWRKEYVKEMNVAIDLATNYRETVDKDKAIAIPSSNEIELKEFFTEGLDLIDSYLTQYRQSKEK
jgi:hypothetical protein